MLRATELDLGVDRHHHYRVCSSVCAWGAWHFFRSRIALQPAGGDAVLCRRSTTVGLAAKGRNSIDGKCSSPAWLIGVILLGSRNPLLWQYRARLRVGAVVASGALRLRASRLYSTVP